MEMEYKDPSKKGRWVILLGLVLAIGAAAGAFLLINQAQQNAGKGEAKMTTAVVAAKALGAKAVLTADDLTVRDDVPLDTITTIPNMVATTKEQLVGRILGVDVAMGQLMTLNLLASTTVGGQFPILGPGETVAPDSDAWRAVSISVADDRAVGGMIAAGMTVDVLMTQALKAPWTPEPTDAPVVDPSASPTPTPRATPSASIVPYSDGLTTKVTYQKMKVLAKNGTFYILKATLPVAEEMTQASLDGAMFTILLRPDQDARIMDASGLGATTSRILQRYGLIVPQAWPVGGQEPSAPPIPAITPAPSETPTPSPAPSASPAG